MQNASLISIHARDQDIKELLAACQVKKLANAVEQSKKAEAEEAAAAFGHKDLCVTLRPK